MNRESGTVTADALVAAGLRTVEQLSIVFFDREMRILAVHGGAVGRHGYIPERMIGRRAPDVLPAEAWATLGPLYTRALTGESVTVELASHDGAAIYETTFQPVRQDGTLIGGMATSRDITARREADAARSRWQHAFDRTTLGVAVIDPQSRRMVQVNAAFARMHGGGPADFEGQPLAMTFAPHERVRVPRIGDQIDAAGRVAYEAEHERLDGTRFPAQTEAIAAYDEDGNLAYRIGYFRDITEQRRTEAEREAALAQFGTSFTKAPIGMCLVGLDGRFLRVNDALASMFGRSAEDLLAADFQQLTHPEDLAADLALLQETLAGHRDGYQLDKRYLRPDGGVIAARLSVSLVRDRAGAPAYFISQLVDLTALDQARAELAEVNARLQAILDHSPTAIYLRDLEHRWQVVNPETCRIIGMPAEELLGRSMADTHPPELFAHLAGHDAEVLAAGEAVTFDEVAPDSRTGRTHHWWSAKFPVRDAHGTIIGLGGMSLDVTDREEATRELAAARELLEAAFEHAPVGKLISRMNADGSTEVIKCNPAFAAMLGMDPADLLGRSGVVVVHPEDLPERSRMIDAMLAGRQASGELRFLHRDGHEVWTLTRPARVTGAGGETLFLLQALDISERKRLEGRLRQLADHDALTGLYSRRRFEEELAQEVARVRRRGGRGCLLLLDLDGFKDVNDAFGHSAGDALLTRIGGAIHRNLREVDVLARLGGDEFAVILPDTDLTGARTVAAKLVAAVREHGRDGPGAHGAEVTASIGVTALHGGTGLDAEELLVEADIAMYQAKADGKDQVCVYERAGRHRDRLVRRAGWLGRLRQAVREEQFVLLAQPVVPLLEPAGDAERYELLLRLRGDRGELITPRTFLHHAERDGLIVDIDRWVLGQAVELLHRAHADGRDLSLAVNFSARTVQDPGIACALSGMLAERPIPRGALMIEVTETAAITNVSRAVELGRQLRDLGCKLALDDFGAGFASFFYLKHLDFDVLKIDGDFIDRLTRSTTDQLVVRAVRDIASGLGAQVVAERVADQPTLDLLTQLGVDYAQGFYLGRPAPLG